MNPILASRPGKLGRKRAAHLLRRATFNSSPTSIKQFSKLTATEATDLLFNETTLLLEEPIDPQTGQPWINSGITPTSNPTALRKYVLSWWINEARLDTSIRHRLTYFLSTILTVNAQSVKPELFFDLLKLLDFYHKGSFKDLIFAISKSNAMLIYLDNASNNANNPNENYARELLELFTIGKGTAGQTTYNEVDVQQAARVLTGFKNVNNRTTIDPVTSIPTGRNSIGKHDTGTKTFPKLLIFKKL